MNNQYVISLGSNVGDSLGILKRAVKVLSEDPRLQVEKKSSLYKTKPWGKTDQPPFVNAAIEVSWQGEPDELMTFLLQVEKLFGRKRDIHWGPRTLDLDMIYGWHVESQSKLLRLPHPYFWERPFVLVPMEEMTPQFSYEGISIGDRIAMSHGYEEVEKIQSSWEDL